MCKHKSGDFSVSGQNTFIFCVSAILLDAYNQRTRTTVCEAVVGIKHFSFDRTTKYPRQEGFTKYLRQNFFIRRSGSRLTVAAGARVVRKPGPDSAEILRAQWQEPLWEEAILSFYSKTASHFAA